MISLCTKLKRNIHNNKINAKYTIHKYALINISKDRRSIYLIHRIKTRIF